MRKLENNPLTNVERVLDFKVVNELINDRYTPETRWLILAPAVVSKPAMLQCQSGMRSIQLGILPAMPYGFTTKGAFLDTGFYSYLLILDRYVCPNDDLLGGWEHKRYVEYCDGYTRWNHCASINEYLETINVDRIMWVGWSPSDIMKLCRPCTGSAIILKEGFERKLESLFVFRVREAIPNGTASHSFLSGFFPFFAQ